MVYNRILPCRPRTQSQNIDVAISVSNVFRLGLRSRERMEKDEGDSTSTPRRKSARVVGPLS